VSSQPDISAVIVNFNAGQWLGRAVRALLDSSTPVQLMVVDNDSSDDSLDGIAKPLEEGRLRLIRNATNRGYASASNQVLAHAQAEYYLLLNPDCEVDTDTIGHLCQSLLDHPEAAIAGALVLDADGREQRACRRREPTPARSLVTMLGLESWLPDSGVNVRGPLPQTSTMVDAVSGALLLVRGSAFRHLGGFDEAYFLHCEDLDLFHRIREAGWKVLFEPAARAHHAKGVSQKSAPLASERHKHAGMVRYYRRHLAADNMLPLRWVWPLLIWAHYQVMAPIIKFRSRVRR
jgi:GT2 family glycosyltransferase